MKKVIGFIFVAILIVGTVNLIACGAGGEPYKPDNPSENPPGAPLIFYTIRFLDADGGDFIAPQQVLRGNIVARPEAFPIKQSYVFTHWYISGQPATLAFDFSTAVWHDIDLMPHHTFVRPRFVVFPALPEYRFLDPDAPDFDERFSNTRLRRHFMFMTGNITRSSLNRNSQAWYRRDGYQILNFYTDRSLQHRVEFDEDESFWPNIEFNKFGLPKTFIIYINFLPARFQVVDSADDIKYAAGMFGSSNIYRFTDRDYFFNNNIELGGGELRTPSSFGGEIRGNGYTVSNFEVNISQEAVTNIAIQASAILPYAGLFDNIAASARIADINFRDVMFNFRIVNAGHADFRYRDVSAGYPFPIVTVASPSDGFPGIPDTTTASGWLESRFGFNASFFRRPQTIKVFARQVHFNARIQNVSMEFNWRRVFAEDFGQMDIPSESSLLLGMFIRQEIPVYAAGIYITQHGSNLSGMGNLPNIAAVEIIMLGGEEGLEDGEVSWRSPNEILLNEESWINFPLNMPRLEGRRFYGWFTINDHRLGKRLNTENPQSQFGMVFRPVWVYIGGL